MPDLDNTITFFSEKWQEKYNPEILIVKKDLTEKDYFTNGIKLILDYYAKHYPFKDNTLELEKEIILKLGENAEHEIIGFIDRLAFNKETQEYEIHDYKTANSFPSKEKIEADRQLALYSIAIKELFGKDEKVCLIWHYLNFDQKICSRRTKEQLEKLKKEILEIIKEIEDEKYFPYNKSPLCNWCEYKNICPACKNEKQGRLK